MINKIANLNVKFSYKNINLEFKNFLNIYKNRPIKNNQGGCRINHAFALYYILKILKPELVIESGIFKGQTTWLIEKTVPKAKLICIDINLSQRKYISHAHQLSKFLLMMPWCRSKKKIVYNQSIKSKEKLLRETLETVWPSWAGKLRKKKI